MASKKGIIVTAGILAVIAGVSFVVWILPQNVGTSIVVTDYKNELDGVKERFSAISSSTDSALTALKDRNISPDEFISQTQVSSSQLNSLIGELVQSNAPAEWRPSYASYFESLRKYNDFLTEAISLANKIKDSNPSSQLEDQIAKMDSIKNEAQTLALKSDQLRP